MSVINVFAAGPRKNQHGETAIVVKDCTNIQKTGGVLPLCLSLSRMYLGIR